MGQTLSAPVTTKHTDSGEDERYAYGVSEMQGWRISMEDAHTTCLSLEGPDVKNHNALFAVFDGHGGSTVAKFSGENLYKRLAVEDAYRQKEYETALKRAFLGTDEDIRADPAFFHDPSGCTAVAALLTHDNKVYVANAGDSRSIISVKGEAKPLSFDHKPMNESETSRITAAGGYIEFGRVNGNLALSRAIGDFEFKKNFSLSPERQIITADPDITKHDITDEDEFLVLACDGIWDCLSSQQVVDVVRRLVHDGKDLTEICNEIMEICLAPDSTSNNGIGCDNMTVMVIALLNGRTKEEWYAWMKDRVANDYGYETPAELPQIYSISRIEAARNRAENLNNNTPTMGLRLPAGGLGGLARVLAGGGISFTPDGWPNGSGSGLMFDHDDSEEEDSEGESGSNYFSSLRAPQERDVTISLKEQLDELRDEDDDHMEEVPVKKSDEGETMDTSDSAKQGEAPPPPTEKSSEPQQQLGSRPLQGEEPSGSVKAEGLADKSEDPMKSN